MRINQISQTTFKSENNRGQILLDALKKNPNAFYERPIDVKLDIIYEKLNQAEKERKIINENIIKMNKSNAFALATIAGRPDFIEINKEFKNNTLSSFNTIG